MEEERQQRMEKLAQRRENLENDQKNTQQALNSVKQAGEKSEEIEELNDLIQVLIEQKDSVMEKFNQVSEALEDVIDENKEETTAKYYMDGLKSEIQELENQLKIVEVEGSKITEFGGIGKVVEVISIGKQWIQYFWDKIQDAQKRQNMQAQYDSVFDNLRVMKEHGSDAKEMKHFEDLVKKLKGNIENIKPTKWTQKDVDNFRDVMDCIYNGIDDIKFVGTNLTEAINQLAIGTSGMLSLE